MKFYTGIGSRQTPEEILILIKNIATKLNKENWTLRSGHAQGADLAFERGANDPNSEIYLPWFNFNCGEYSEIRGPVIGKSIIDKKQWLLNSNILTKLKIRNQNNIESHNLLHGRNVAQILGLPENKKSSFVIYYAPVIENVIQGGTRTAVMLAQYEKIPTFNLWNIEEKEKLEKWTQKNSSKN